MAGPKLNHSSPIAIAYAAALLELANEQKQAEAINAELSEIREIIADNPSFGLFLSDPAISEVSRGETIQRIFGGKIAPLLMNFLGVVNEKGRLGLFNQIVDAYGTLLDAQLGKIEVDVTVAAALSGAQLDEVKQRVGAALQKTVIVKQQVDESIIGGLVLRVQDRLIDASVKTQLAAMKQQLLAARPR